MYATMAKEAREESFDHIAFLFEEVAKIEKEHEERYRKLLANVEGGLVFSRDGEMIWQCSNCGHIHVGKQAPEMCPVCAHAQGLFPAESGELLIETGPGAVKLPGFFVCIHKIFTQKDRGAHLPKKARVVYNSHAWKIKGVVILIFPIKAKEVCAGSAGQRDPCLWPVQHPCVVRCDGGRRVGYDAVPAPLDRAVAGAVWAGPERTLLLAGLEAAGA